MKDTHLTISWQILVLTFLLLLLLVYLVARILLFWAAVVSEECGWGLCCVGEQETLCGIPSQSNLKQNPCPSNMELCYVIIHAKNTMSCPSIHDVITGSPRPPVHHLPLLLAAVDVVIVSPWTKADQRRPSRCEFHFSMF